jgi:putative selenate reductase
MSDKMQPISFQNLVAWIFEEYKTHKTIFGIPEINFFKGNKSQSISFLGSELENPIGPAAGPHTQLTQNIISAYLTGGRFFELKTVQKMDELVLDKPCIDAADEGYNVEWSQELKLDESYDEYLKAWFLIHIIKNLLGLSNSEHGFIFNMSVGYDLDGIKTERMDRFIEELKDASKNPNFTVYKNFLTDYLTKDDTKDLLIGSLGVTPEIISETVKSIKNISPFISNSVTLSTMHGCPPHEIEAIANYLIKEKKLHTYVKMNPTLLGYENVTSTLQQLGYKYLVLDPVSFDHDLQYNDAIPMLKRLIKTAGEHNQHFGVKLSNTLGVKNTLKVLKGDDMYMSGRSLFPLTIRLAEKLATEFKGEISISYSGGATVYNTKNILGCGIRPITFATDLLKPGGYIRLKQISESIEPILGQIQNENKIALDKLTSLANNSLKDKSYNKEKREIKSVKIQKSLPPTDCYIAPCQEACPIHQDVAAYIQLVEQKKYEEAYELIISKNPLPHITGYICDHQCMQHCTRWDYDEPLLIREIKKEAALNGYDSYLAKFKFDFIKDKNDVRVAIIGAGPAGLSSAYFLAKAGFDVTIFEKELNAGGIVQNVLPKFRLPQEAIEKDIEFIEKHGIRFVFGMDPNYSIAKFKKEGYKYVFVAIGAQLSNSLDIKSEAKNVFDAIDFLKEFREDKKIALGKNVAIIGGGNSAMDSARAAKRCEGTENVFIIYRRTKGQMPADKEEFFAALEEGVEFKELLLPVKFENDILTCRKMKLGDLETDGRNKVIPIDGEYETIEINSVISAIGEKVDTVYLLANDIQLEKSKALVKIESNETSQENVFIGGDAFRGPSTVVESIADGKKIAEAIIKKENLIPEIFSFKIDDAVFKSIPERKGRIADTNFKVLSEEASRCLGCNFICDKCAEVCPNRANIALEIDSELFSDKHQILHIDGMCNECGNCETFCPYHGAPCKEKLTLFWSEKDLWESKNNGFLFEQSIGELKIILRLNSQIGNLLLDEKGALIQSTFDKSEELTKIIEMVKTVKKKYAYLVL